MEKIVPRRVSKVILADTALFAGANVFKAQVILAGTYLSTTKGSVANLLLLLFVACLFAGLPTRVRRSVLFGGSLLISILFFIDIVHYRALREFLSLSELGHAAQLTEGFTSVFPYVRWPEFLLLVDVPIWIWWLWRCQPGQEQRRLRPALWLSGMLMGAGAYGWAVWDYVIVPQINQPLDNNRRFVVREVGLLSFHLFDALDLGRGTRTVDEQDFQRVQGAFAMPQDPARESIPFGVARKQNLIFVQVESLEAFVIGLRVYDQEVTPHFNRLANESFYFNRFFPQTSLGQTADGEFCALNSLLPARTGVVAWRDAKNSFRSLPRILVEHGYRTAVMSVCRSNLWNMGWMHHAYGFQKRYYYEHFCAGNENPLTIDDGRFFARARELLRDQPRPFFAHLLTISSHSPFTFIPANQRTLRLGGLQETILGDYLQAAHFVDEAIGQFLDGLKADGLARDTVVFIYGDHEALPIDERRRAQAFETDATGSRLDEHLRRRVPLFIIVPGAKGSGPLERVSGQIDLAPTVLHLLGLPRHDTFFLGENLFRDTPSLVYFRTGAFATDHQFHPSRDDLLQPGACEPIAPGTIPNPDECARILQAVRQRIEISDLVLEQNMIPALLKVRRRSHEAGAR